MRTSMVTLFDVLDKVTHFDMDLPTHVLDIFNFDRIAACFMRDVPCLFRNKFDPDI